MTSTNIAPAALRVTDAATYLGISRSNIYKLVKKGELRFVKVGGRTTVLRKEADDYLNKCASMAKSSSRKIEIFE